MQVERLVLENFRGFEGLDLALHPRLSVLIGANGSGKSSVLDALCILCSEVYGQKSHAIATSSSDVRNGSPTTTLSLHGKSGGTPWSWQETFRIAPQAGGNGVLTLGEQEGKNLPNFSLLVAFYSVRRALLGGGIDTPKDDEILSRSAAYRGALGGGGAFDDFLLWFRAREDVENEIRLRGDAGFRDGQLQAVRGALSQMMPGYQDIYVQRHPRPGIVLSKGGASLFIRQLSDGEKCLLAVVGDIARRLAILAPEGVDPLSQAALVMIDEIELHLHPGWQREVVPALLRTFPGCQFVLTTHSPQVLASVASESVILLDQFRALPSPAMTKGRDSTSILTDLMGLPEHPGETAARLHQIAESLDRDDLQGAKQAIEALASELGEADREVLRLRSLLSFLGG